MLDQKLGQGERSALGFLGGHHSPCMCPLCSRGATCSRCTLCNQIGV